MEKTRINSGRKLFFGLFIFPLLIAVGMAVLLCSVVILTSEEESPESLIAAIKSGSPSKRWQKAFELSNELNRKAPDIRSEGVMNEIVYILQSPSRYDEKTRSYMAVALSHFRRPAAVAALRGALNDESAEVRIYAMWSLGVLEAKEALPDILPLLDAEREDLKKMAVYVAGVLGDRQAVLKLRTLLDSPVEDIRWNAALGLARLGDDSGLEVLHQMLDRPSLAANNMREDQIEKVMINAAKGLALIQNPKSFTILESVAQNDKNLKVRQAVLEAIRRRKSAS